MGFGEKLSGFYVGIEDKWFSMLDWLDARGIPVYKYSDFLENHGIPSFPFTIALIFIIAFLLYGIFFVGMGVNPNITINIADQFDESVSAVRITIKNAQGLEIKSQTINDGGTITLQGIPLGTVLTVYAEKTDYETASEEIEIKKENYTVSFKMQQKSELIDPKILLQDTG